MFLSIQVILEPIASKIWQDNLTSIIFGTLYNVKTPFDNSVAGNIAIAEFFAPIIETSPLKGVPPVITNFSISSSKTR